MDDKPEDTPGPDRDRGIAHLADGALTDLGHSLRHLDAAKTCAGDPARLRFNLDHLGKHLDGAYDHARRLVAGLACYYPAVGAELAKLHEITQSGPEPAPVPARSAAELAAFEELRARFEADSVNGPF